MITGHDASNDPIIIAGAGIGGLTTAIALRRHGLPVRVLERAGEVRATGSGLTIQINAMRALATLDLDEPVASASFAPEGARLTDEHGRILQKSSFAALTSTYGAPSINIQRGALMDILVHELRALGVEVETAMELESFKDHGEHVEVSLTDGIIIQGCALIGADGIWSAVRSSLLGDAPARYAGYTCWRGIAPVDTGSTTRETWGRGARFGVIPLSTKSTYWFAVADAIAGETPSSAPHETMRPFFEGWTPDVMRLILATPEEHIIHADIHDRPPVDVWGDGLVTLLGDAAHPMTPNMGQGACQAIEDGVVLARTLHGSDDIPSGLRAYESGRRARANWFVKQSWSFGRIAHGVRARPLRVLRDTFLSWTPGSVTDTALQRMYAVSF